MVIGYIVIDIWYVRGYNTLCTTPWKIVSIWKIGFFASLETPPCTLKNLFCCIHIRQKCALWSQTTMAIVVRHISKNLKGEFWKENSRLSEAKKTCLWFPKQLCGSAIAKSDGDRHIIVLGKAKTWGKIPCSRMPGKSVPLSKNWGKFKVGHLLTLYIRPVYFLASLPPFIQRDFTF